MGSLQHMNKLAQELRASMPTHPEPQPQSIDFGGDVTRSLSPIRSAAGTNARRAPLTGTTRRIVRAGHGDKEMQLLEKVRGWPAPHSRAALSSMQIARKRASELTVEPTWSMHASPLALRSLAQDYEEVRTRYEELLKQNEVLKTDTRRRMESYIRREQRYKQEISELRDELRRTMAGLGGGNGAAVMAPLHAMHGQILDGLSGLQEKTKAVLQEQESDLLRAFRARLYDVQMELEAERSKKDDGALEWIERTRTLGKELDWSREEALRLDRTNQHLAKENGRLRSQAVAQDDDRQFLLRQLVSLKKENASLRDTNATLKAVASAAAQRQPSASGATTSVEPLGRPSTSGGSTSLSQQLASHPARGLATPQAGAVRPMSTPAQPSSKLAHAEAGPTHTSGNGATPGGRIALLEQKVREGSVQLAETERRAQEVVGRLKKMVEAERKALRALRATHTRELQSRTELEVFLRQCIADVKAQLVRLAGRGRAPLCAPVLRTVWRLVACARALTQWPPPHPMPRPFPAPGRIAHARRPERP